MEAKALACNIVPGRLPRGPAFEAWIKKYVPEGGPPNLHPEQPPPEETDRGKPTQSGYSLQGRPDE
jgi:hypothetical protein